MGINKTLSVIGILFIAACSTNKEVSLNLEDRSIEKRCAILEGRWEQAQISLIQAENRQGSSWLYNVTDSFNPLTSNQDSSFKIIQRQEQRARENYTNFGCMEFNRMQIQAIIPNETKAVEQHEVRQIIEAPQIQDFEYEARQTIQAPQTQEFQYEARQTLQTPQSQGFGRLGGGMLQVPQTRGYEEASNQYVESDLLPLVNPAEVQSRELAADESYSFQYNSY